MKENDINKTEQRQTEREQWKKHRAFLEREDWTNWRRGTNGFWFSKYKHQAVLVFGALLKATGFFKYGYRNARDIQVRLKDISPKGLPEAYSGYRILHLSDLHLDGIEGLGKSIARIIAPLSYDLCVITGDFRSARHGEYRQVLSPLHRILSAVTASDGIYAVLGNHDTHAMSEDFEDLGIHLLTNQTVFFSRTNQQLYLTGVDDPHDYYTEATKKCLESPINGFRILLAHSPELYHIAAANNFSLYLCGHSHGGQICLPGGWPLMTCLDTAKHFYKGLWHYRGMIGHTSTGCGTAKIPIRFNCRPEVTILTLTRHNHVG
jgi:predicted MPP superfamily phosphohydrolase